ncbi:MAG: antA/AntB antirepressor family protein [Sphaerochaeta sp.]
MGLSPTTSYRDWFPRMCRYGFEEGKDFRSNLRESTGGRPSLNHTISIAMARELLWI